MACQNCIQDVSSDDVHGQRRRQQCFAQKFHPNSQPPGSTHIWFLRHTANTATATTCTQLAQKSSNPTRNKSIPRSASPYSHRTTQNPRQRFFGRCTRTTDNSVTNLPHGLGTAFAYGERTTNKAFVVASGGCRAINIGKNATSNFTIWS